MATAFAGTYFVIPLSVQRDGQEYTVGSTEIDEFYQFPVEGVRILELLRAGEVASSIKRLIATEFGDEIDTDEFIASLGDIGFIYPAGDEDKHTQRARSTSDDPRLTVRINPVIARALLSPVTFVVYVGIVATAVSLMIAHPALRPNPRALALNHDITLTMIPLLLLYACTVTVHEGAHMLAAARHGVRSKLGLGNRLWAIVAEADLSGILTLPKRQRYLPLLAGLMADVLTVSLATLAIAALLRGGQPEYVVTLLQALVLQIIITITWQFNLFLKTDVYYVMCTFFNYPDLDNDARRYLAGLAFTLSAGRIGAAPPGAPYKNPILLRLFAGVWFVGRAVALAMLIFILIPTLFHYIVQAYHTLRNPAAPTGAIIDQICFLLISTTLFGWGLVAWLGQRFTSRFRGQPA